MNGKPNWSILPIEEKLRLTEIYETDKASLVLEAHKLAIHPHTLERQIRTFRRDRDELASHLASKTVFPASPHSPNEDYLVLKRDSAVIISDVEVPDNDSYMLKAALLTGIKRNIRTIIYNGDIVATDQSSLNTWDTVWKEKNEVSYEDTIRTTEQIMLQYGNWFTEQYFVSGNHDQRINKVSGGEVHLGMLLKTTPTIFSRYAYMYLKTSRGWVYICHPTNFSENAAAGLGKKLWANTTSPDGSKCHIVLGHTHQDQHAWSPDSKQEIHSSGCMRQQAAYADLAATTYSKWQRSFLVLDQGYFYHMTEYGTDWKKELGDLYGQLA